MEKFKKYKKLLGVNSNKRIVILFVLPIIASFFETFGISSIVSFVTVIMDENALETHAVIEYMYHALAFNNYKQFAITMAILLVIFYIVKTVFLSIQCIIQNTIVKKAKKEVSLKVLRTIMNKPYEYFTNINAAEIIRIMNDDINRSMEYLLIIIQMFTEILVTICLLALLFVQDAKMMLFVSAFLGICIGTVQYVVKRKIAGIGKVIQTMTKERTMWLNQSVQGIKDIKVGKNEKFFENKFDEINTKMLNTEISYSFWYKVPSYIVEMTIMVCVLLYIIIMLATGAEMAYLVPTMTAFALAAVRLLPACNRISSFLAQLIYRRPAAAVINDILSENEEVRIEENEKKITIDNNVELLDIYFRYSETQKYILENANMEIKIGEAIGIIGASGAGKTTVIDILLGLLKPQKGLVLSDGIDIENNYGAYLDKIAYIPQSIFLIDDTIKNNVAFGVKEELIDEKKVYKALEDAQLLDYVNSLPEGINTMVGEFGTRISGGQKQRIGIARALYNEPELLVLDEATSALDNETESAIMESIRHLKGQKTMIIIAHRLSTIKDCDKVYKVKDGKIEQTSLDN